MLDPSVIRSLLPESNNFLQEAKFFFKEIEQAYHKAMGMFLFHEEKIARNTLNVDGLLPSQRVISIGHWS